MNIYALIHPYEEVTIKTEELVLMEDLDERIWRKGGCMLPFCLSTTSLVFAAHCGLRRRWREPGERGAEDRGPGSRCHIWGGPGVCL